MKIKYCFILFFVFVFCLNINAQNEKVINGETYITEGNLIQNKKNLLADITNSLNQCKGFSVKESAPINNIIRKTLNQDKIDRIIDNSFAFSLRLFCNEKGEILEVYFSMPDGTKTISLNEIYKIECALKNYKFELANICPNTKYYIIVKAVHLWRD